MKMSMKRSIAFVLAMCMFMAMVPLNVLATGTEIGTKEVTSTENPPAPVDGGVWVLVDSKKCTSIEHAHNNDCYYQTCDHKNGHISTCYGESTSYVLCEHDDESAHTGTVTLAGVVTIDGTNVAWVTTHPAYDTVYAVYKTAYDEAYASAKYLKEIAAKAAGVAALVGKTFCYTTSASATPDKCTHGECSDVTGSCYSKICIIPEHAHNDDCYKYTWELKSDVNKNGIADDADTYYTVTYISNGEKVYEKSVLVDMPTPTIENPSKEADAQYTYTFVGWDTPVADKVVANATYTAVFTNTVNKYTVTWKDENGTVLKEDKNVEYGTMPHYDGKEPTKEGNNELIYTFAGWTPAVEEVTGNVTYTATYTTSTVYPVEFYIDGELVKTEYVVENKNVAKYEPTREHYALTAWQVDGANYDFTSKVTGAMKLHASWELKEVVVNVSAPNASYELENDGVYALGSNIEFAITPNENYVITKVTVNGTVVTPTYEGGKAIIKIKAVDNIAEYKVVAETHVAKLVLNSATMNIYGNTDSEAVFNAIYNKTESMPNTLKVDDVTVEYLAYEIDLLGKHYEWWVTPGTDVSLKSFLDQYGLASLADYIPTDILPHKFASKDTETVRVTFDGDDQYPALSEKTVVAFVDDRIETKVVLNENIKVTYGAKESDILALVFKAVYAGENVVTNDITKVDIEVANLNAGTRKVVVSYDGDNTYAASVAEVEITIEKAQSFVNVNSTVIKYGTNIDISNIIKSNASCIEVVMGVTTGANASANAGAVAYINIPDIIDVDKIENETIKKVVSELMSTIEDGVSGTMTVAELNEALNAILPYVENIEGFGFDVNLSADAIQGLIAVLNQMENMDGINALTVNVAIGGNIVISDAGVYVVAGVTSDANYTSAHGINYVIIYPDGYKAELDWNVHDENGIITIEALNNGYDLSAYVANVAEGTIEGATAHLKTLFIGVDKDGQFIITENQKELTFGAYTEIAFLADLGNTAYYAEPIARSFIVTSDIVNVKFFDENGNVNHDRIFAYGEDASMKAKAFDRNTNEEITKGTMTYFYTGLQTDGQVYYGKTAPTYPGAYTVIALFIGDNGTDVGTAVAALVIEQKDSDFALYDDTVIYDGNEHFVKVTDTVGFEHIYVVVDSNNNVNVILPKDWNIETIDAMGTVENFIKMIHHIEIPEELSSYYNDFIKELNTLINEIDAEIDINSVIINGKMPVEIGEYDVYGIAFGKADYKIVVDNATLTIKDVTPETPDEPETPEEPKDPTEPEDPTEPSEPENPEDPTEPENPTEPDDDKDDDKDENDSPQTGDNSNLGLWIGLASASLIGIVAILFVSRKKKNN